MSYPDEPPTSGPATPHQAPGPAYPNQPPPPPWPQQTYPGQPAPPGYQLYATPQPPRPKSRTGLIVGIVSGVLVLCLAAAALVVVLGISRVNQASRPAHVVVDASGSSAALVTFRINGDPVESDTHPLPYSINRDVPRGSNLVTVIVFPIDVNATVTCRITVDGRTAASQTSTGQDNPAICETHV